MPSASWLNGWLSGDQLTAAELGKSMGAFFDSTLGGAAASFDITSVPTWGSHLMIELYGRGDTAATTVQATMRFNNDSGANYSVQAVSGVATTTTSAEANSVTSLGLGSIAAASATANYTGAVSIVVPQFRGTTFFKSVHIHNVFATALTTGGIQVQIRSGVWASTSAITRVTLIPSAGNFAAGTRCTAYVLGP